MKIGIVGSMQEEIDLLKSDLKNANERIYGKRIYAYGELFGENAVLVFSRWGKVASASTVTTLIDRFDVDFVVFTGVAGAGALELEIGDIVISSELVQHDMDASALPMFKKFEIPLLGVSRIKASEHYIDLSIKSAKKFASEDIFSEIDKRILDEFHIKKPKVAVGVIASGDRFVANHRITTKLRKEIGDILCVEMEGAAVAQVCYEHDIPFVVIRAISDKADRSAVIDFPRFVEKVACYYTRGIIRNMLLELV